MPWFSCIPSKDKHTPTKNVILEKILLTLCEASIPMIYAGVISFSNGFAMDRGWEYKVSSDYENNNITLKITIKDKIETLVKENDEQDDCVVCTNPTNQKIRCCNQTICLKCLKEIKKRCNKEEMDFCCPVCRKNLDSAVTTYDFDKYFLDKLKEAGENEKEKINLFKNILV